VEFGHALDLNSQTVIRWQLVPLILDDRGKQEPVSPRCRFVHIHQDQPFFRSFPTTFEGCRNIFITAVATQ
jgi:hypothetical protein